MTEVMRPTVTARNPEDETLEDKVARKDTVAWGASDLKRSRAKELIALARSKGAPFKVFAGNGTLVVDPNNEDGTFHQEGILVSARDLILGERFRIVCVHEVTKREAYAPRKTQYPIKTQDNVLYTLDARISWRVTKEYLDTLPADLSKDKFFHYTESNVRDKINAQLKQLLQELARDKNHADIGTTVNAQLQHRFPKDKWSELERGLDIQLESFNLDPYVPPTDAPHQINLGKKAIREGDYEDAKTKLKAVYDTADGKTYWDLADLAERLARGDVPDDIDEQQFASAESGLVRKVMQCNGAHIRARKYLQNGKLATALKAYTEATGFLKNMNFAMQRIEILQFIAEGLKAIGDAKFFPELEKICQKITPADLSTDELAPVQKARDVIIKVKQAYGQETNNRLLNAYEIYQQAHEAIDKNKKLKLDDDYMKALGQVCEAISLYNEGETSDARIKLDEANLQRNHPCCTAPLHEAISNVGDGERLISGEKFPDARKKFVYALQTLNEYPDVNTKALVDRIKLVNDAETVTAYLHAGNIPEEQLARLESNNLTSKFALLQRTTADRLKSASIAIREHDWQLAQTLYQNAINAGLTENEFANKGVMAMDTIIGAEDTTKQPEARINLYKQAANFKPIEPYAQTKINELQAELATADDGAKKLLANEQNWLKEQTRKLNSEKVKATEEFKTKQIEFNDWEQTLEAQKKDIDSAQEKIAQEKRELHEEKEELYVAKEKEEKKLRNEYNMLEEKKCELATVERRVDEKIKKGEAAPQQPIIVQVAPYSQYQPRDALPPSQPYAPSAPPVKKPQPPSTKIENTGYVAIRRPDEDGLEAPSGEPPPQIPEPAPDVPPPKTPMPEPSKETLDEKLLLPEEQPQTQYNPPQPPPAPSMMPETISPAMPQPPPKSNGLIKPVSMLPQKPTTPVPAPKTIYHPGEPAGTSDSDENKGINALINGDYDTAVQLLQHYASTPAIKEYWNIAQAGKICGECIKELWTIVAKETAATQFENQLLKAGRKYKHTGSTTERRIAINADIEYELFLQEADEKRRDVLRRAKEGLGLLQDIYPADKYILKIVKTIDTNLRSYCNLRTASPEDIRRQLLWKNQ